MQRLVMRSSRSELPTPGRLFGAVGLTVTAFFTIAQMISHMPPGTQREWLLPFGLLMAALLGWRVAAAQLGQGFAEAGRRGMRAALYLGLFLMIYLGALQMLKRALRMLYDGPFDALMDVFAQAIDLGAAILQFDVILTLFLGGVLSAMLAEWAARRWK